jgi:hypothetical protein
MDDVLYFEGQSRELRIEEEETGLATGEQIVYTYEIDSSAEPLEITLVWTDYAATQGANPALVNNLDLKVERSDGTTFLGNHYSGGQSTTGGVADSRNVEECVRRNQPVACTWTITVRAVNVPQGTRQPFALVSTGSFAGWPEPPASVIGFDPLDRPRLDPPRPNPFSRATGLSLTLPAPSAAQLSVYDTEGRLLMTLVDAVLPAGAHHYEWDGRLPNGSSAGSGTYYARLQTDRMTITRKMSRLR